MLYQSQNSKVNKKEKYKEVIFYFKYKNKMHFIKDYTANFTKTKIFFTKYLNIKYFINYIFLYLKFKNEYFKILLNIRV